MSTDSMKTTADSSMTKEQSRNIFYATFVLSPLLSACAIIQLILVGSSLTYRGPSTEEACHGAQFRLDQMYDPFNTGNLFTPTWAFGSFSFSTAKTIDIIWDLFVGRGGQAILMYIAYRVFASSLVFSMESRPAPYQVFAAIAFNAVSISTIGILGRECIARWQRTWRRRLTIMGLILASLYILAFPTLVSAMTGYDTNYSPYVNANDGSMLPFSGFQKVAWVVKDGSRVGLTDDAQIEIQDDSILLGMSGVLDHYVDTYINNPERSNPSNGSSIFDPEGTRFFLDPPYLDIDQILAYKGENYTKRSVVEKGICQPGKTYRWGFSSAILFFFSIFQVLWIFIMWVIWSDARQNSHVAREGYTLAPYRAALDLSQAIRQEIGEECDVLSDKDLQLLLHRSGNGMLFRQAAQYQKGKFVATLAHQKGPPQSDDESLLLPLAVNSQDIGIELTELLADIGANTSPSGSTSTVLHDGY